MFWKLNIEFRELNDPSNDETRDEVLTAVNSNSNLLKRGITCSFLDIGFVFNLRYKETWFEIRALYSLNYGHQYLSKVSNI